jgi:hypothetical protein
MPPGRWQYVFSSGKQLPHLQKVLIRDLAHQVVGATEIASLVSACPNLQTLDLSPDASKGNPAEVLAPLSTLASLQDLSAEGMVDDAALSMLAQLTGLTALSARRGRCHSVTAAGLLPLTDLRQLKKLCVGVDSPDAHKGWHSFATTNVSSENKYSKLLPSQPAGCQ